MALVEYGSHTNKGTTMPPTAAAGSQSPNTAKMLADTANVSAEEVGQLIHHLQEEIKIIKQQLENLPGYASGKASYFNLNLQARFHRICISSKVSSSVSTRT
jgi:hypothetical protein